MLEGKPMFFTVLAVVAILIGGMVEIIPMFLIQDNVPTIASVKPYTPLEVLGRDIYIREGCLGCHSQMIRPFRSETERYGEYSKAGEFVYDHPFLWGSERKGPDLAREGGKYPDAWHYNHMDDPRSTSPGSIMPRYSWLLTQKMDTDSLPARLIALRKVGVPYPAGYENGPAQKDLQAQAEKVVANLKQGSIKAESGQGNHRADRVSATARHGHQIRAGHHRRQIINRRTIMEKKSFSSMDGVGIYGMISILHLLRLFHRHAIWAFALKKNYLNHMGGLPLDGGEKNSNRQNLNPEKL